MKIESVEIKNFKAISSEKIDIKGSNVYVLGKNGVGKSSFLDAIFRIINGSDMPTKLVKEGQEKGHIDITLDNGMVLKAKFNSKNEKVSLSVESADGSQFKSPRTMLDEMAGVVDFDINDFFNKTTQKQIDFIKHLVGIDFTDLDEEKKKAFDERTIVNSKVKDLESKQEFFKEPIATKVPIEEIQKEIRIASVKNDQIRDVESRSASRKESILALKKQIEELEALEAQSIEWLGSFENEEVDTEELQKSITDAIEFNSNIEKSLQAKKLYDELKLAIESQSILNDRIKDIEETKRRVISEASMPVDGLTFSDNELFYKGLPFDKNQINTAQQIIIGLQINMALLKDIKIARFDGSLLDSSNIELVEAWAKENDLQLFVEFVERNSEGLRIEVREQL
jgi:predicted ATP-dependent endonuclease of OLD family